MSYFDSMAKWCCGNENHEGVCEWLYFNFMALFCCACCRYDEIPSVDGVVFAGNNTNVHNSWRSSSPTRARLLRRSRASRRTKTKTLSDSRSTSSSSTHIADDVVRARARASRHNMQLRANTMRNRKQSTLNNSGSGSQVFNHSNSNSKGLTCSNTKSTMGTPVLGSMVESQVGAKSLHGQVELVSEVATKASSVRQPDDDLESSHGMGQIFTSFHELEEEERAGKKTYVEDDDSAEVFWYTELAQALEEKDDRKINREILRNFFKDHDKSRLDEVDVLLRLYDGQEEVLFALLNEQYPDVTDSGLPGRKSSKNGSFASMVRKESMNTQAELAQKQAAARIPSFNTPISDGKSTGELRGKDIPVAVGPFVNLGGEQGDYDYILSAVAVRSLKATGPRRKWATNLQNNILRRRMIKAGASEDEANIMLQRLEQGTYSAKKHVSGGDSASQM